MSYQCAWWILHITDDRRVIGWPRSPRSHQVGHIAVRSSRQHMCGRPRTQYHSPFHLLDEVFRRIRVGHMYVSYSFGVQRPPHLASGHHLDLWLRLILPDTLMAYPQGESSAQPGRSPEPDRTERTIARTLAFGRDPRARTVTDLNHLYLIT